MKKLLPVFLIFFIACGGQKPPNNVTAANTSTFTPSPTETSKSNTENLEPIINFFSLANKSAKEIEKTYGKPELIDTKSVQFKNGEYRIYNKNGKRFLQVDYFDGKAVAFYLEIPEKLQSQSPDDTLKICGLTLKLSEAEQEGGALPGWWWKNPPAPFYSAKIQKYGDTGLYWSCEVQIKV